MSSILKCVFHDGHTNTYLSKYLNIVHLEFEMKPERKKNDKKKNR